MIAKAALALVESVLVIVGGVIIDGTGAEPVGDHAIVIRDGWIVAIEPAATYDPPAGATIVDASGGTVLPGFVNAHTHFTKDFEERRDKHLAYGVTSICNLGAGINQMVEFDVIRDDAGQLAARGLKAGPFVAKEGGYAEANWGEGANYNIVGREEARSAVHDLAERSADFIKISYEPGPGTWPILTDEEARAVVEAAHDRGLPVIAHVEDADYLKRAVDAGVDAVTHVPYRVQRSARQLVFSGEPDAPEIPEAYDRLITRMARDGIVWIPTLDVLIGTGDGTLRARAMTEVVRRFHQRGGTIAMGNDYPLGVTKPGIPLGELAHLADAGLSPMETIVAGTRNSAAICGHAADLGTIEIGKRADLVVVDGDPLTDFSALEAVRTVVLDGQVAFEY